MTREEAIAILNHNVSACLHGIEWGEVLEMAIKALEQEPCEYSNANQHNSNELNDVGQRTNALEGDVISRQAAIVQLSHNKNGDDDCDVIIQKDIETIKALPPVTPQPKYEDIAKAFQVGMSLGFGEKYDEMDRVIDEIKKVITPQPKTGHWIPVSERLPEKYAYTLWCASSGCVRSDYFNGEFWEDAEKYCYEVIAWMPLPTPFEAEREVQE